MCSSIFIIIFVPRERSTTVCTMSKLDEKLFGYWSFKAIHSDCGNGFFFIRSDCRYISFCESEPEFTFPRNAPEGWLVQRYFLNCPSEHIIDFHLTLEKPGNPHRYCLDGNHLFLQFENKKEIQWNCKRIRRTDIDSQLLAYLDLRIDSR